jgi:hypothetical protein
VAAAAKYNVLTRPHLLNYFGSTNPMLADGKYYLRGGNNDDNTYARVTFKITCIYI